MKKKIVLFLFILISFVSVSAVDFNPDRAYERFRKGISIGGSLFPTYEGSSTLLELDIYGNFEFQALGFGLNFPIRFILDNNDDIETTGKIFPKEDWDDARDWVSILSYFRYGHSGDMVYFYFGNHKNRYVGNGTILGAYFSDLKLYYPKRGVSFEFNSDYMGIDFFMDDVTPPTVVGGRFYLKPLSFFSKESYANNLELGFTYFTDFKAPYLIKTDFMGSPDRDIDKYSEQIFGFDINFRFLALKYYQATFYTDINHMHDAGTGLHFGLKHKLMLPGSKDIQILSKWEARAMESNYVPTYFNTFYDIERDYYSNSGNYTKSYDLDKKGRKNGENWTGGYYLDLVFDITGIFAIGGSFEHNRLYNYEGEKYNNYQINVFLNTFLFNHLDIDFLMTFQSLGEEGRYLKNDPFFRASAVYYINKYFSVGFAADSKWYLSYDYNRNSYKYKSMRSYSIGAFGGISF